MKKPKIFSSSDYEDLASLFARNEYHVYDDRHNIPVPIRGISGYSSSDNYVGSVIMASSTSPSPPTIGSITVASSAPIYRVVSLRKDCHSDGISHVNKDDTLIFKDIRGNCFQMTATDKNPGSGHYCQLARDSGLDIPSEIYKLPDTCHGELSDLKTSLVQPHFSTGPMLVSPKMEQDLA